MSAEREDAAREAWRPVPTGGVAHAAAAAAPAWQQRAVFDSDEIFRGADEVHIVHGDALYRLRRTALGKLILTK